MIVARSSGRTARARSWNVRATPHPSTIVLWPLAETVSNGRTGTAELSPSGTGSMSTIARSDCTIGTAASTLSSCAGEDTMAREARLSARMNATCSAESVG